MCLTATYHKKNTHQWKQFSFNNNLAFRNYTKDLKTTCKYIHTSAKSTPCSILSMCCNVEFFSVLLFDHVKKKKKTGKNVDYNVAVIQPLNIQRQRFSQNLKICAVFSVVTPVVSSVAPIFHVSLVLCLSLRVSMWPLLPTNQHQRNHLTCVIMPSTSS